MNKSNKKALEELTSFIDGMGTKAGGAVKWHVKPKDARKGHRSVMTVDFGYTFPLTYVTDENHTKLVKLIREATAEYIGDKEARINVSTDFYLGLIYWASVID